MSQYNSGHMGRRTAPLLNWQEPSEKIWRNNYFYGLYHSQLNAMCVLLGRCLAGVVRNVRLPYMTSLFRLSTFLLADFPAVFFIFVTLIFVMKLTRNWQIQTQYHENKNWLSWAINYQETGVHVELKRVTIWLGMNKSLTTFFIYLIFLYSWKHVNLFNMISYSFLTEI